MKYTSLQITKGGCMGKRLFLVLPVLFVFSFLFVQVAEVRADAPSGTWELTVTKIGFYTSADVSGQSDDTPTPQLQNIVELPSPRIIHLQVGGTPSINDFVYLGNIPNGTFIGIGLYIVSATIPDFEVPRWEFAMGFDTPDGVEYNFIESTRKSITLNFLGDGDYARVTDL
jgi:hypothetical protein